MLFLVFSLVISSTQREKSSNRKYIFYFFLLLFFLVFSFSSSTFLPFLSFLMCQPPFPSFPLFLKPLARKKPGLEKNPPIYRKTRTLISANKVCSEINKALRYFLSPFLLHRFFNLSSISSYIYAPFLSQYFFLVAAPLPLPPPTKTTPPPFHIRLRREEGRRDG